MKKLLLLIFTLVLSSQTIKAQVVLDANGVTIKWTGTTVPSPYFVQASPRGTLEWFAIVSNTTKSNITDYARGIQSGITYFKPVGSSTPIPFNNIVTTLVTDMGNILSNTAISQSIESWDVSNVTNMAGMFVNATLFNQPIGPWNVSNVTNMFRMFGGATTFNQPISSWNVSNVTNMSEMFFRAPAFNQPIGSWNVSNVTNMLDMFIDAQLSSTNYDALLNGWSTISTNETPLKPNVVFSGGNSKYCNGASARGILTSAPNSWVIADGGLGCPTRLDSIQIISTSDTNSVPNAIILSLKSNSLVGLGIGSYQLKLNYNASKYKLDSISKIGTSSSNGTLIINNNITGIANISWASVTNISNNLPLIKAYFTAIDSGNATFNVTNAYFNTSLVTTIFSKSVFNKLTYGDIDVNALVQAYDAMLALRYSVGMDPLPTLDPLPWEPWRLKIANVDTGTSVTANDASLILKYVVGLITKFPKRGIVSTPGYVTVNLENNELVVRSFEDMGGLNITFLDHLSDLGAPTYVQNTNALSAFNKQTNMYKIGVAFSEAPVNGTVILRIPYTGLGSQTLNMELVENTTARNYQLNVLTGINDIKNSNIKIYPNPTNNIINIEGLNKNENNTIQIFDVQGKLVITKTITEKGAIDLSELNKGVYVIKIGEVAQRIVKL